MSKHCYSGLIGNYENKYLGTKDGLAFIKNPKDEYILETIFKLDNTSNGGLGLFFETSLNSDNKESGKGYVLQFDRGFDNGAIIVRERNDGKETKLIATFTNVPNKSDSTFWEKEQKMSVIVKNSNTEGKKDVTILLDDKPLNNDPIKVDSVSTENNYSGFRTWHEAPVTVQSLTIK